MKNTLYYGDNLDILRRYIKDDSIDLIYLDPPFKSNQAYNILFKERNGTRSAAQIKAFEDTWHWDRKAEETYIEIVENLPKRIADLIKTFRSFLGSNDMMAYLVMMAIRLQELYRVLKPTGSIYLHCDPTASHYLKLVMDAVFESINFRNEIIWRRSHPKGHAYTRFARNHDVIISFTKKAESAIWNPQYLPHDPQKVTKQYDLVDENGRRYQLTSLLNPNPDRPNLTYEFKAITRVWRWTKERMLEEDKKGRIVIPRGGKGIPRYKRYLDEQKGIPIDDFWNDVDYATGSERLGYPTQKPEALLERIIKACSNEGDIVLDPFCGCGTTIVVAERLKREWIGIDITHLAISLMRHRLGDSFGEQVEYEVIGEPVDLRGAEELAKQDPFQFQWWALGLVGARPAESEKRKGPDKGIDGYIYFHDDPRRKETKEIIIQVKSGHVNRGMIDALKGVVEKENAQIGVFITLKKPTKPMQVDAVSAGYYKSPLGHNYPKIQILSIKELLEGKKINYPSRATGIDTTFRKAKRYKGKQGEQEEMF